MSTSAHPAPRRFHRPRRWVLWVVIALVVAPVATVGIAVAVDRAFFSGPARWSWPPEPCVVQGIDARCGTFVVPENRAKPNGRTIGLNVVVLPAFSKPARKDAVTFLAGGPGEAATEEAADLSKQLGALHLYRDIHEPWTGLDATGPWGTDFDSYTTARIAAFRQACSSVPKRGEPRSLWTLPATSPVPVLALVGGADPQDPVENLSDLKRHFPDSRIMIFPHVGHQFGIGGCLYLTLADFVDRGTTKGLDTTGCDGAVVVPPFALTD